MSDHTQTAVIPMDHKIIDPDTYFDLNQPPANLQQAHDQVTALINSHDTSRPIVLVTSGGTTVPLENNTVRFVDNFSGGSRGSASAEQFLELGYVVIFLHRENSLQPFNRHYPHGLMSYLEPDSNGGARVRPEFASQVRSDLDRYLKHKDQLLQITFTTLSDYLFLLREVSMILAPTGPRSMFYLAAAVSDFFIPSHHMAEHKIQSGTGDLTLRMNQVPKFLRPLVKNWAPLCFIVSFKLETDSQLLAPKAKYALEKYGHQIVVANLLHTRKWQVWLVTRDEEPCLLQVPQEDLKHGRDIEQDIVAELARRHKLFML
ncbi:Phosphopantothenate--cysteine ligase cab2 [Coemansia sp. RSA 1797]|nr:Phosphopantothenate--cysteine ligase cab2 [Coemansia sp. RSA 1797]